MLPIACLIRILHLLGSRLQLQLRVPRSDYGKSIVCNIHSQSHILVRNGCVEKMVVMTGQEEATADTLRHPLLVQHQTIIIGNAQIEQSRFAGDHQVKTMRPSRIPEPIC